VRYRISGLYDELRPGPPRLLSEERVARLIRKTLRSKPRDGSTHWSVRSAAHESGISKSTVHRYFELFGLQPHKSESFKLSTDPFFIEKLRAVAGLYLHPPEQVERFFALVTEKAIRRGSFRGVKELIAKIDHFVTHYNKNCKPFVWTATADSVLEKIERLTSNQRDRTLIHRSLTHRPHSAAPRFGKLRVSGSCPRRDGVLLRSAVCRRRSIPPLYCFDTQKCYFKTMRFSEDSQEPTITQAAVKDRALGAYVFSGGRIRRLTSLHGLTVTWSRTRYALARLVTSLESPNRHLANTCESWHRLISFRQSAHCKHR
jgi:hypothetical protein